MRQRARDTTRTREPASVGRWVARHSRSLLVTAVLLLAGWGWFAAGAQQALELSRWDAPGTESVAVQDVLREEYGTGNPNLALLVTAADGDVDSAATAAAGRALAAELADHPMVTDVTSYWTDQRAALRAEAGDRALVLARLEGSATDTRAELAELSPLLAGDDGTIAVEVGGQEEVSRQISEQSVADFVTAELIVIPAVLLLLVLVYRRAVAALLTLGVGVLSVLGTLAGLRLLAQFTPVSTFAANLALVLGLGLGIDYGLFVINRYREERHAGHDQRDAAVRTVATAGRTVLFSGLTVAVSLSALLLFPFFFLSSFAYAGILTTATAVGAAALLLPAALVRWGHRVERAGPPRAGGGLWHRAALAAMRRPVLAGGSVLAVLLLAGAPALGLRLGLPDERTLPEGASSREAAETRGAEFAAEATDTLFVVSAEPGPVPVAEVAAHAAELSRLPGVFQTESAAGVHQDGTRVAPPGAAAERMTAADGGQRIDVVPTQEAMAGDVPALVADVRAVAEPYGALVGGYPAETTDFRATLLERLPLVAAVILVATCGVLFLLTGSVLLPLKATVLNLLSLTVMFGALVWIFQEGNLSGVLGFTPAGAIEPSIPVLMFCVTYGLSMDYEVFLLSRISEEHRRHGDTRRAVAEGIRSTAPLISAAAAILAGTFAVYATSGVVFLKMLGVGTALVILADATLVRLVLLPVAMRLAGRANWWAPRPLRRLHRRFGLREAPADAAADTAAGAPPEAATDTAAERPAALRGG